MGPGAFIAGLEYSTGVKCEVVGKPEAAFFNGALHSLGMLSGNVRHMEMYNLSNSIYYPLTMYV